MLKQFVNNKGIRVYKNYIGGKWVESSTKKMFDIKNPATD